MSLTFSVCSRILQGVKLSPCGFAGSMVTVRWRHIRKKKPIDDTAEWSKPLVELYKKNLAEKTAGKEEKQTDSHMLHVIYRIKPLKGRPWWEKKIMVELGLDGKMGDPVIHKNIPSVNKMLVEVKHLIKIQPMKFPHGLPEHESDFDHTLLKSNGEFLVRKRLQVEEEEEKVRKNLIEEDPRAKWHMKDETVSNELDRQRREYRIHAEYFKEEYNYKRNQDGKEYRYNFSKKFGRDQV